MTELSRVFHCSSCNADYPNTLESFEQHMRDAHPDDYETYKLIESYEKKYGDDFSDLALSHHQLEETNSMMEAQLAAANERWEKADVAVYELLNQKNRLVLLIGELKRALNRCLDTMEIHDKRASGEYNNIPGETMNCMWQDAKSIAKVALATVAEAEKEAK